MPIELSELQRTIAILETRLNGAEKDMQDIKELIKYNADNICEIRNYFNKLVVGGLGSVIVILVTILTTN